MEPSVQSAAEPYTRSSSGESTEDGFSNGSNGISYVYSNDPAYPSGYHYQPANVPAPAAPPYSLPPLRLANSPTISVDGDASLGHIVKHSPMTVQWLVDNYEAVDGGSLPRCLVYEHYKIHCNENELDPVNAASFGKLIRNVFQGLQTKRLGTRGNSKYHYYGIRIRAGSSLHHITESTRKQRPTAPRRIAPRPSTSRAPSQGNVPSTSPAQSHCSQTSSSSSSPEYQVTEADRLSLGEGHVPVITMNLNGIDESLRTMKMDVNHVLKFADAYSQNCADVLYCVKQLQFDQVEECWASFWQSPNISSFCPNKSDHLTQTQIHSLCTIPQVQRYVVQMDYNFYQVLIDVLMVDVLSTRISCSLTNHIHNSAKRFEDQLKKAMSGAPDPIQKKKLAAIKMFVQMLKRYTSINYLARETRPILLDHEQTTLMLADFNRLDMTCLQEQAGWISMCDEKTFRHFQKTFRENLQNQKSLEEWAKWMEGVVDSMLAKYQGGSVYTLRDVARQFLLHWSLYSSLIIRDLTLRSANSFRSFHLIHLLFDDYMFYLVEQKLARALGQTAVSVMAQDDLDLFQVEDSAYCTVPQNYDVYSYNTNSSQWELEARPLDSADMVYIDDKATHYIALDGQLNDCEIVVDDVIENILEPEGNTFVEI